MNIRNCESSLKFCAELFREIPTIIHSLNLVPTQGEMHDIISEMEEGDNSDTIKFEKFLAVMTEIMMNRK